MKRINWHRIVRVLLLLNMLFFFLLNSIYFMVNSSKPDGYIAATAAIFGAAGAYFNIRYYELAYLFSSIIYSYISFNYYLVGEGFANLFICGIAHIVLFVNNIRHKEKPSIHMDGKKSTLYSTFMAIFSIIGVAMLYRLLVLFRSTFADWESASIVLLCWAFYFEIKNKQMKWFFWLFRNAISLYIWFFINDRSHIEMMWLFHFIQSILCVLEYASLKIDDE